MKHRNRIRLMKRIQTHLTIKPLCVTGEVTGEEFENIAKTE